MEYFLPEVDVRAEAAEMERYEENQVDGILAIRGAKDAVLVAEKGAWSVVTSAQRLLAERRLASAGLPVPRVLVPVDEIERGKPDPEGYLKAAKLLQVAPDQCVVFEDTRPGVEAAEAAGMRAVGLLTTFSAKTLRCEWVIRDFRDIRFEHSDAGFQIFTGSLQ